MHFCSAQCFTLVLRDGQYVREDGSPETWTIERFTADSVILHRHDPPARWNGYKADVPYVGKVSNDEMVAVSGAPLPGMRLAWGKALDSVPANNEQRDHPTQRAAAPRPPPTEAQRLAALQPRPPITPHMKALPAGAVDLSGVWERVVDSAASPPYPNMKVLIVVSGNDFVGITLNATPLLPAEEIYLAGSISTERSMAVGTSALWDHGLMVWAAATLTLNSADSAMVVFEGVVPGIENTLTRVSHETAGDIACDARARTRISGVEAFARGKLERNLNNINGSVCWFHVAAVLGDPEGEAEYGSALIFGSGGLPKDEKQGVAWLQKAAMHGSRLGAQNLSAAFVNGRVLPPSSERARYWKARAILHDPDWIHTDKFMTIPKWANDTATDCDPPNPQKLDADAALTAGRVAFLARLHETAACWFGISAAQGNVHANVYLGLLSMFGWGVRQDTDASVAYMNKAAKAGSAFALLYLANFYRYGIGVKQDDALAYRYMQASLRAPDGAFVYGRVQGTGLSLQPLAAVAGGLNADQADELCRQNEKSHPTSGASKCNTANKVAAAGVMPQPQAANHTVERIEEIVPELDEYRVIDHSDEKVRLKARAGIK
jgi:TPR repeat protein